MHKNSAVHAYIHWAIKNTLASIFNAPQVASDMKKPRQRRNTALAGLYAYG
jgi:hypothetical protein